ncbi:MAG: leucine-rich repeat protein, partial [Candidatus Thorarchaeota archaeon]
MRVYVTGKVTGMTKKDVKELVESKGHEFSSFTRNTDLLVYGLRAGPAKISNAHKWGVKTMSWEVFEKFKDSDEVVPDDGYIALDVEKRSGQSKFNVDESVEILWMNSLGFTKIDLTETKKLPNLTRLHLENNGLKEIDLTPLKNNQNLSWLMLSGNSLTGIDFSPLSTCQNLSTLELAGNQLQNIDLAPLSSCDRLYTLSLASNKIRNIDLNPLAHCRSLRNLYLSDNELDSVDMTSFSRSSSLNQLFLDGNSISYIDLSPIAIRSLNSLNLARNSITKIDLTGLQSCEYLGSLDLSYNKLKNVDLSPLSNLSRLWKLSLYGNGIRNLDLTPMAQLWGGGSYHYSKVVTNENIEMVYQNEDGYGNILLQIEDEMKLLLDPIYREQIKSADKHGLSDLKDRIIWIVGPELAKKIHVEEGWLGVKKRLWLQPKLVSLSALSMIELGGLERSIDDMISCIPNESSFAEGLSMVYSKAVMLLQKQLEDTGSTHDLDIEMMKKTEAAILIPQI